jgi:GR25 family glycosyltransferase involved in LPS biosynthesis
MRAFLRLTVRPCPSAKPVEAGEIGVFLSHRHALEQAKAKGQCVHILEDDALLTPHLPSVIGDAIGAKRVRSV